MNPFDPQNPQETPSTEASETKPEVASKSETPEKPRRPRGFAAMDRKKVSEIASKGGKAAHAAGTAHQFSSDEARLAGRKGGIAPHVRRGRGPRQPVSTPSTSGASKAEAPND